MPNIPTYADLPTLADTGEHHSWDVFGRGDELGTLNFLTPAATAAAAHAVREGRVVCLSLPLNVPYPALASARPGYTHTVTRSRMGRDDSPSGFFLQCSSQWDSLQHIRFREFGYYGGREEEELDRGALGMDVMARHGIVGRGVLVDAERFARARGESYAADQRIPIGPDRLDAILAAQGTALRDGDILLMRMAGSPGISTLTLPAVPRCRASSVAATTRCNAPGSSPASRWRPGCGTTGSAPSPRTTLPSKRSPSAATKVFSTGAS